MLFKIKYEDTDGDVYYETVIDAPDSAAAIGSSRHLAREQGHEMYATKVTVSYFVPIHTDAIGRPISAEATSEVLSFTHDPTPPPRPFALY